MKRQRIWLCGIFMVLVFIVSSATFYGAESKEDAKDTTLAPYFFIESEDASVDSFPLKETKVTTNINGVIADIYVVQTYANEGEKPINARYVFPASTKVSIHGMKMEIGDKVVTAKIKEREEAKKEFEQAKSKGKSASLLEQERPNVFTMSVANIMPGDTVRIELHYTEMVVSTDGAYQFVFPTVAGPRYSGSPGNKSPKTDQWVASPYLKDGKTPPGKYDITVNLSAGVPITDIKCKSHKVNVTRDDESAAKVTLSNSSSEEFAGNRDFILDYKLSGQEIRSGLILHKGETENFFMLMMQPPERFIMKDMPPREYIFVLDVSGSMDGYPLNTAKELIRNLVAHLKETDSFNLILFAGASTQMSPKSVPATEVNIKSAIDLIERQNGSGGTELAPALERAVALPRGENVSRSVVIITDGLIDGERAIFDIINKNLGKTNFFSFGIGTSVNRHLLNGIAQAGLGESFVVTKSSEASGVAERFRTYIQSPVLTDIQVKYTGFDAYDIEPTNLPTLFAQRPIILFGKWRGEPSGTIQISGKTGNHDYVQNIQVSKVASLETNDAIRYLWARSKVERLTDYGVNKNAKDVKKEVTKLGLDYSMMTPYTSFVAVIDTIRNKDKKITDVNQPLPLPLEVSNLAVGGGYTIGSEPEIMILIPVMLFTLLLSSLSRGGKKKALGDFFNKVSNH